MKIVLYINSLRRGGAERVMANLAESLTAFGHECVLVTSFKSEDEYFVNQNVKRICMYENHIPNIVYRNFLLTFLLRKVIKKEKADAAISFMAEPNFRLILSSFGLNVRTLISVRNDPNKEYPSRIFKLLAKVLYKFADHVVFQTENAKKWFSNEIQKKSTIIFNPVDEVFFRKPYDGVRKNIVSIGRLVPQKNHEFLIKSFALIANKINDDLYIYGEGFLRHKLEQLIHDLNLENRIFLPGIIKNVPDTIQSAKLFVLSSIYEGMPNSLMEAMALGIPCISTDCPCGGPRMLLNENFLVQLNDVELMSKKILEICMADSLTQNYRVCVSDFSIKKVIAEWNAILL